MQFNCLKFLTGVFLTYLDDLYFLAELQVATDPNKSNIKERH